MKKKIVKFVWADNLRAIATIAVIFVHVSAPILYQYGNISNFKWWSGNVIDGISRFCVPIFLMLTGALLLPRKIEIKHFFKKRLTRILLPFLFWSVLYIIYSLLSKWLSGDNLSYRDICLYIFHKFKSGASFHLWYIYMIIGIYLILPIISKWILVSSKNEIWYYVVIWIVTMIVGFPFIKKIIPNVDLIYFTGYLGYPILGYLLSFTSKNKKIISFAFLLFLIGIMTTIFGTYLLSYSDGSFNKMFYSYLSPNVLLSSIGVFLLFRHLKIKNKLIINILQSISKYNYGIYLGHILVLKLLSEIGISWNFINPIVGIILTAVLCLSFTLFIVFLVSKIPFGKYFSG